MKIKQLITLVSVSCLINLAFAAGDANVADKAEECKSSVASSSVTEVKAEECKSPVASSSATEVKVEGLFNFQAAGVIKQSRVSGNARTITDNKRNPAFYTDAGFFITVKQQLNEVIAGAKIVLLTTTKPNTGTSYNGSHIFLETCYGKVELGSPYDAAAKMRITGYSVIAATTNWSRYIQLDANNMKYKGTKASFDTTSNFFIDSFVGGFDDMTRKMESSRKISYYTPKMKGFQFGISYIPDSSNIGSNRELNYLDKKGFPKSKTGIERIELEDGSNRIVFINQNVINAVAAGISYERELKDDVALKLAITGEYGKPARRVLFLDQEENILFQSKLSTLKAYNIGGMLTCGNFSYAASYGSLGKSLTTPDYHKTGRVTKYYNGAISYSQGPIKTSIAYFRSSRYRNILDVISLGSEYKITSGLVPYAELSYFQAKGRPAYFPEAPRGKTKGTVALIGAKLKF